MTHEFKTQQGTQKELIMDFIKQFRPFFMSVILMFVSVICLTSNIGLVRLAGQWTILVNYTWLWLLYVDGPKVYFSSKDYLEPEYRDTYLPNTIWIFVFLFEVFQMGLVLDGYYPFPIAGALLLFVWAKVILVNMVCYYHIMSFADEWVLEQTCQSNLNMFGHDTEWMNLLICLHRRHDSRFLLESVIKRYQIGS